MSNHQCKICQSPTQARHTINDITYYFCPKCHFLQNYYWDTKSSKEQSQTEVNDRFLQKHWLPSEPDHDYDKAWEMLQLIAWPPAWYARQANDALLQHIPGYRHLMRQYVSNKLRRLMDLGCGHGTVLLELAKRDPIDIIGVDPYAPNPGPRIFKQDIFAIDLPDNSFDAIFAIETMEHLVDPIPTFNRLRQLIKPGGVLLVQTRRQEDPDYQQQQDKWFYLKDPQTHVSIYSIPTMEEIAKRTNWKKVQCKGAKYTRFVK